MENEFNSKVYNAFKIPSELLNKQSEDKNNIQLQVELFKAACIEIVDSFRRVITKMFEIIKKFFNENPWILNTIKRSAKYQKRVKNRNRLYIIREKIGRKL